MADRVETIEDVDAPGLELEVADEVTLTELREAGLTVKIRAESAGELDLALRSFALKPLVPGMRGSSPRPQLASLAIRHGIVVPAGSSEHVLELDGPDASVLPAALEEEGWIDARVVAQLHVPGSVAIANRALVLTAG